MGLSLLSGVLDKGKTKPSEIRLNNERVGGKFVEIPPLLVRGSWSLMPTVMVVGLLPVHINYCGYYQRRTLWSLVYCVHER